METSQNQYEWMEAELKRSGHWPERFANHHLTTYYLGKQRAQMDRKEGQ